LTVTKYKEFLNRVSLESNNFEVAVTHPKFMKIFMEVDIILQSDLKLNKLFCSYTIDPLVRHRKTFLYACLESVESVKAFLEHHPECIDFFDQDGNNCFNIAAAEGKIATVIYLNKQFPNSAKVADINNKTAIIHACYNKGLGSGNLDVVKFLLQNNIAGISTKLFQEYPKTIVFAEEKTYLHSPLNYAAIRGGNEEVLQLLHRYYPVEFKKADGSFNKSLLYFAIEVGSLPCVKYFMTILVADIQSSASEQLTLVDLNDRADKIQSTCEIAVNENDKLKRKFSSNRTGKLRKIRQIPTVT